MRQTPFLALCVIVAVHAAGTAALMAAELPEGFRLEPVVSGLTEPSGLASTPDRRLLVTERTTGRLRVMRLGELLVAPACTVTVDSSGEGGLLGVAVHPQFNDNNWIYLYYTAPGPSGTATNKVTRYALRGSACEQPFDIVSGLEAGPARSRNGGGIGFGLDGKLYVATGDMESGGDAQDPGVLQGKVLRLEDDGIVPVDNPTPGSPVFAIGVRDGRGLSVNSENKVYVGDAGDDASVVHDELNVVAAGGDLGWDDESGPGGIDDPPLVAWLPTVGIHGVAAYDSAVFPDKAADGVDNDRDKWGADDHPGVARTDDNGTGVCIGSANNGLSCAANANCQPPSPGSTTGYCEKRDEPAEWCPGGVPFGDDACGSGGVRGVDEPDESFRLNVFATGQDEIARTVLTPGNTSQLHQWETFLDSTALPDCPTGWTGVAAGTDGFLYAVATNQGGATGALYRIIHDQTAGPREVSKPGSYFPLRVDRGADDASVVLSWEDLRDDALQPRDNGLSSLSPAREYTVWVGTLGAFYSHAPAAGLGATAGTEVNAALRRSVVGVTPGVDQYFLVSARSANFEGTLGSGTASARPGYAVTDLCTTIGRHEAPGWDLFKCGQDFTLPNARNEVFSLRNLRGRPIVLDFSAFWCAPCYLQADNLETFYQQYTDRGVEILSVVMDEESTSSDWNGRPSAAECRVWEVRSPLCILTNPPNGICTVGGGPCTNSNQCPDPLDHTFDCVADTIACSGVPCSGSITQRAWPRYNAHGALPTNIVLDQGFRVAYTDAGFDGVAISTILDTLVGATDQCLH